MPKYVREECVEARDCNWLGFRVRDALKPHVDKIITNTQRNVGCREAWVQFELMYALTRVYDIVAGNATNTGLHGSVYCELS